MGKRRPSRGHRGLGLAIETATLARVAQALNDQWMSILAIARFEMLNGIDLGVRRRTKPIGTWQRIDGEDHQKLRVIALFSFGATRVRCPSPPPAIDFLARVVCR
jgi:hypothetical protein